MVENTLQAVKDYSQNGEQKVILEYFGAYCKTVLDIGANDGATFSNSRALIESGSSAVLVEPSPGAFAKLCHNSHVLSHKLGNQPTLQQIILICAAITPTDGPVDFYDSGTHLNKGDVALLSTTVPAELERWKKSGEQFTKTTVRGIAFESLLKECGRSQFDFISIDAEGADYSILAQIDLRAVGCQLLCIECNQRGDDRRKMMDYCAKAGMRLHWTSHENLIFAR